MDGIVEPRWGWRLLVQSKYTLPTRITNISYRSFVRVGPVISVSTALFIILQFRLSIGGRCSLMSIGLWSILRLRVGTRRCRRCIVASIWCCQVQAWVACRWRLRCVSRKWIFAGALLRSVVIPERSQLCLANLQLHDERIVINDTLFTKHAAPIRRASFMRCQQLRIRRH